MELNNEKKLHGLFGSKISRTKAVGYCYLHQCHLSVHTLKTKQCLHKQCSSLKKHEEHPYWKEREVLKQRKKANRELMKLNMVGV